MTHDRDPAVPPLTITVVSDVMCPWCFIGKRRLAAALALVPDLAVSVTWRPFQLDPTIPPGGMDRQDYLDRKFGPERVRAIHARIAEAGRAEGIPFAFERIRRSPNTLDAHRLVHWAGIQGLQDAVVERLFALYFLEGADIGDHGVLAAAAADAGQDGLAIAGRLATDEDKMAVRQQIAEAHALGIDGVPAFIVADRYLVAGAQPADVLARVLAQVVEGEEG